MPTLAVDEGLLGTVAANATASEAAGRLAPETVEALRSAGIFAALVPSDLGGRESHPAELRLAIERISTADAAAGWCAAIGATSGLAAAYLTDPAAGDLFGGGDVIAAGAFAPRGGLSPSGPLSYEISGRWQLGSGVSHSTIVGLGCIDRDRNALYALVPAADVEISETWDSLGLRATASHDISVSRLIVPSAHVIDLVHGRPTAHGPLYAFPLFGLLALAISAVCTGIAQGALDDVVAIAREREPAGSTRSLAQRATTQEQVASATAALRAARAGVDVAIAEAWATAERREPLDAEERAGLRIASTHAAQTAVAVVDEAHRLGGAGALYRGSTLERRLRDVHTAAQHMLVAPGTLELAGRVLLGLETDTAQL